MYPDRSLLHVDPAGAGAPGVLGLPVVMKRIERSPELSVVA
jgi:hypothetical protein